MTAWLHGLSLMSCFRIIRNQKWMIIAFVLSVYLSLFVVILSYQVITRMPRRMHYVKPGRVPLKLGTHANRSVDFHMKIRNKLPKIRQAAEYKEPIDFTPFEFSRNDLRLQFKEIPTVSSDPFYDNTDQFHCEQGDLDRHHPNITEDLWCENKAPQSFMHFLEFLQNVCQSIHLKGLNPGKYILYKGDFKKKPRPKFLDRYKNPCFMVKPNALFPYGGTTCLPYFHILGADKCGTTDFHSRLTEHPRILLNGGGLGKETYYWCWLRYGIWMRTEMHLYNWQKYLAFFYKPSIRIVTELRRSRQQMVTGDGTPMDLWDFRGWEKEPHNIGLKEPVVLTPHLMRHMYKDPRFFVLMRNPVDRLYSDYIFLGYGFTPEKFARDVPIAIARMRDCLKVNSTRNCFFSNDMYHRSPMRLHIGCYSIFLREWLSVFQRKNFFFMRTEDYHTNMTMILESAFRFLDVDPLTQEELRIITSSKIKHQTVLKQKVGNMYRKTRTLLEEFYAPFNEDLSKLMGDKRYLWKDVKETPVVTKGHLG